MMTLMRMRRTVAVSTLLGRVIDAQVGNITYLRANQRSCRGCPFIPKTEPAPTRTTWQSKTCVGDVDLSSILTDAERASLQVVEAQEALCRARWKNATPEQVEEDWKLITESGGLGQHVFQCSQCGALESKRNQWYASEDDDGTRTIYCANCRPARGGLTILRAKKTRRTKGTSRAKFASRSINK